MLNQIVTELFKALSSGELIANVSKALQNLVSFIVG
jgi:hypothetical protein